jgi:glutathione S-transferase
LASRAWLARDRLTLADLPAGATLYRWFALDLDRPAVPNVEAWYGRLAARPAYRKHVTRPFPELEGRLAY